MAINITRMIPIIGGKIVNAAKPKAGISDKYLLTTVGR
jgi:hypothetical protein